MMQEIIKEILRYNKEFIVLVQTAIKRGQDDMMVAAILLLILALIFVGFIWIIQYLLYSFGRKKRSIVPYDPERVAKYNEDLSGIVGEGKVLVEILENEIRENQHQVTSLRDEVEALREERVNLKEEIRLMEESPTELADSLKRDSEQKVKKATKKGNRKAFKMIVLGLFLGFLITSTTSGFWLYNKNPDMVKTEVSSLQSYVLNLVENIRK